MSGTNCTKIVISDCHLSAGRFFEGKFNPHEDFHFDEEMCSLFRHFSTGRYGETPEGPANVELIIDGDYFDFLNVPIKGEFEEGVTEEMAVRKIDAILAAHPKVMTALRDFASKPGKRITYLIGNHDADLAFAKVREKIIRAWDPEGCFPSEKVAVLHDRDRITYDFGVEIRHGNQFEAGNEIDFENAIITTDTGVKILNLPWGSIYVLKIVNRLKQEREYLDKIRPIKVFILFSLILDPWFTIKFCFLSWFYFIKTRIFNERRGLVSGLVRTVRIIREESSLFWQDMERPARKILDDEPKIQTVIFGHTHRPMDRVYPDGKQYINTGTWTKMVHLDWRGMGAHTTRPFALIEVKDGKPRCELRNWVGESGPHKLFNA
jgi:UDP-2,3-diacylglucosamine pyrophosphatase LpxH